MPTHGRARRLAPAVVLATIVLLGATPAAAADRDVTIVDFAYTPASVTIRVGDSVTWTNRDTLEHTATATDGSFDTGLLATDAAGTIRFTKAGTYAYLCTPHPSMTATVVVRAAKGSGSGGTGRPPDTSTVDMAEPQPTADVARFALLALVAALALIVADRALRGRRETSDGPTT